MAKTAEFSGEFEADFGSFSLKNCLEWIKWKIVFRISYCVRREMGRGSIVENLFTQMECY